VKKKPDRKIVVAVLVLMAGAATAKSLEVQKVSQTRPGVTWLQSQHR
jgi:hypothetical protein